MAALTVVLRIGKEVGISRRVISTLVPIALLSFQLIVCCVWSPTVAEAQFVSDGLVGRWTFDAIIDGKVKDVVGRNHGTLIGKPRLVEGRIWSAMYFTGVDRVEIVSVEELVLNTFTVDVWIKADDAPHNKKISRVLAKGVAGANYALTWHHEAWNKLSQSVSARTSGGWLISSSARRDSLLGEEWYNFVGSYDGRELKIFVDAELRDSKAWIGTPLVDQGGLAIGAMVGGTQGFEGVIDEVKIYNRALTGNEITDNFEMAKAMAVEYSMLKLALTWGQVKSAK